MGHVDIMPGLLGGSGYRATSTVKHLALKTEAKTAFVYYPNRIGIFRDKFRPQSVPFLCILQAGNRYGFE